MNTAKLGEAVRDVADAVGNDSDMRDVAELLKVLARVIEGRTLASAFGAPGDWGYSHPIGKALAGQETIQNQKEIQAR